jgi:hypothetical protein
MRGPGENYKDVVIRVVGTAERAALRDERTALSVLSVV